MGWFGYNLYDGDETQTCHISFIKTAIPSLSENIISEFLQLKKTVIPDVLLPAFKKGIPSLLKKIKSLNLLSKARFNEDNAIMWQMLLSLFVDNNLKVPHKVLVYGLLASHYLLGEHSEDFNFPYKRRTAIKRFIKMVDGNFCSVKARKVVNKLIKV